jgi:diguanylate cyclase
VTAPALASELKRPSGTRAEPQHPSVRTGEAALAYIRREKTSAEPRPYETWFAYASGHHAGIKTALDDLMARKGRVTDRDLEDVFDQFLSPLRFMDRTCSLSLDLTRQVDALVRTVETSQSLVGTFRTKVDGAAARLEEPSIPPRALRGLLKELLSNTREMLTMNEALQVEFGHSQQAISGLQAALETARRDTLQDALTGLANRKAFDTEIARAVARAAGGGSAFSLLMIDIDHFKRFNDAHGHLTGDQVIRLVGATIRQLVRTSDLAARYGGEEFALVLSGAIGHPARHIAEKIRQAVMTKELVKRSTGEVLGKVTVSIGAASFHRGDTPSAMIERADRCLYAAKRSGRNRTVTEEELGQMPAELTR